MKTRRGGLSDLGIPFTAADRETRGFSKNNPTINIPAFGLPVTTCSWSKWCAVSGRTGHSHCYAVNGSFKNPQVQRMYLRNLELCFSPMFVDLMDNEIKAKCHQILRVFTSGDFPSVENAEDWTEICQRNPETWFTFFTRKWRVRIFADAITELSLLPNVVVMASVDPEMLKEPAVNGRLPHQLLPKAKLGVSYVDVDERYLEDDNLVVCPKTGGESAEEGTHPTCATCRYCYGDVAEPHVYYISHGDGVSPAEREASYALAHRIGRMPKSFTDMGGKMMTYAKERALKNLERKATPGKLKASRDEAKEAADEEYANEDI